MRKNIVEAVFFLSLSIIFVLASVSTTFAAGGCVPVYGGGVECPKQGYVLVDKKVQNPKTGVFVDNLIPSDLTKYRPQEIVTFRIIVSNSGDQTLNQITLKDTIPSYADYMSVSGADGQAVFDAKARVVTFTVLNLAPGTSRTIELKARTVHPAMLPADQNVVCPVNIVTAETAGQNPDRDESKFCIEKEIKVPAVPPAGPKEWLFSLAGFTTALITGLYLRKKAYQK